MTEMDGSFEELPGDFREAAEAFASASGRRLNEHDTHLFLARFPDALVIAATGEARILLEGALALIPPRGQR